MDGVVFNIQRYSLHDGPGIRTVIFLKGCPLRCWWCDNPESFLPQPQVWFLENLCSKCGRCVEVCPKGAVNPNTSLPDGLKIGRDLCNDCLRCAEECPTGALDIVGQRMDVDTVLHEVSKDRSFYRHSGGGVTLSGGEPLLQHEFSAEILSCCYRGNIHTVIETSGFANRTALEQVAPFTDIFYFDMKVPDRNRHREYTGQPNELILDNLYYIGSLGKSVVLRIPTIPGINDDRDNLRNIIEIARKASVKEVHLLPFHQFGKEKYRKLSYRYRYMDFNGAMSYAVTRKYVEEMERGFCLSGLDIRVEA